MTFAPLSGSGHAERDFQSRRKRLLSYYASSARSASFQAACAKLETGIDEKRALQLIDEKIRQPFGDMFFIYPLIGTYLHFQDRLPEHLKQRMKNCFHTYTPYRGDTENHWLMYYTTLFLAAQAWPEEGEGFWFNGKSSRENYLESREYLNHWIRLTTRKGQGEFDSPDYAGVFLSPLTLLYDFCEDPEMRQKAGMMLDLFMVDWAGEHLKGMLCGGFSRVYEPQVFTPRRPVVSTLLWLYFGDCLFNPKGSMHEAIFPALSSYRCPEIIRRIATDRSVPYTLKEKKRVRNVIRYGQTRNPPVYKTAYMTRHYCLGSLQGGILQPIQQHTWSLTWVSDKAHPTIFTLHPYYSQYELAMFFPEEPKIMVSEVVKSKGTYNKPDKWTGGSPFEQTFQHRNTLIVLYDIPEGEVWPYIDGFFPHQLEERREDPSGWIFCREGPVFIGLYPFKSYRWISGEESDRLRSSYRRNGMIVEAASSDKYAGFEAFVRTLRGSVVDLTRFDKDRTVIYTNQDGETMRFTFDGPRVINGEALDFSGWPLFESPYLEALPNGERLLIRYGNFRRLLDFRRSMVQEWVENGSLESDRFN
jgi:hypothetical protein